MKLELYKRNRSPYWQAKFKVGGRWHRVSTGTEDEAEALQVAARLLVEASARSPEDPDTDRTTLGGLLTAWEATKPLDKSRRHRDDMTRAKCFARRFGNSKKVAQIKASHVSRWVRELEEAGKAPATISRYRTTVSAMFKWGVQHGLADLNPVTGSYCPSQGSVKKKQALTPDEVEDVLRTVCGTALEGAYMLAFFAGMRRSELANARWGDVNFEAGTIFVRGSKTDDSSATLPLHPRLKAWLQERQKTAGPIIENTDGGHYHPASLQNLRRDFENLPGFHVARHTLATILVKEGESIYHVRELLRHTSVRTTERFYAWAAPTARSDVLARFLSGNVDGKERTGTP